MKKVIEELRAKGFTIREIMKKVGLHSTSAVYHYLRVKNYKTHCLRCNQKLHGQAGVSGWIDYCCENKKCTRYKLMVLV